jgi:hypothetical protein
MPDFPEVRIVGMHFRGQEAKSAAVTMPLGTILRLEREPSNIHDYNAIKAFYSDLFLGYVEGTQAAWIAPHMDTGTLFQALVTSKLEAGKNTHPVCMISADPDYLIQLIQDGFE